MDGGVLSPPGDAPVSEQLGGWLTGGAAPAGGLTTTLGVLVAVAAGLLVPAGIAKLRAPGVAREALGLPVRVGDAALRALGVGELLLAAGVLLAGGPVLTGALALTYVAFTGVAARQRARGESCGCFGVEADTPTSLVHVVLDAGAATAALAAALAAAPSLAAIIAADGLALGLPLLGGVVVATVSAQLLLTLLPDLSDAARRGTSSTGGAS